MSKVIINMQFIMEKSRINLYMGKVFTNFFTDTNTGRTSGTGTVKGN